MTKAILMYSHTCITTGPKIHISNLRSVSVVTVDKVP